MLTTPHNDNLLILDELEVDSDDHHSHNSERGSEHDHTIHYTGVNEGKYLIFISL